MNNVPISYFTGEYNFLSNFYPAQVFVYPTVEHGYQAMKTIDPVWRKKIREATTPGLAKRWGREAPIRNNWNEIRIPVMVALLKAKFTNHLELRRKLLDTGNRHLEEGNYWGDTFWGVYNGKGSNHLGILLMELRERIRKEDTL